MKNIHFATLKLGRHVTLNLDCTVGHDARNSNYTTVYPREAYWKTKHYRRRDSSDSEYSAQMYSSRKPCTYTIIHKGC